MKPFIWFIFLIVLFSFSSSASIVATIPSPSNQSVNLTEYWKNDGSSTATGNWELGNNTFNIEGNLFTPYESSTNTATMVNSVVVANNSFYFDGTAGIINPGNVIDIQTTDSFTANIWVKRNDDQDIGMVIQTNNIAANRAGIRLGRDDAINIFHRRNGASATTGINSANDVFPTDGNYYLITMIKTPTSLTGFVNGVEVVSTTLTSTWDFSHTRPWTIGQRGDGVNFNQFTGYMKGITIYDKALTEEEILAIYQAGEDSYTPVVDNLIRQFHADNTDSTTLFNVEMIPIDASFGKIRANDYLSADGTVGWTGSCSGTVEVKNGLIVGCS
jgi:hypothetical protein